MRPQKRVLDFLRISTTQKSARGASVGFDLVIGRWSPSFQLVCPDGGTIRSQESMRFLPTPPEPSHGECQPIGDVNWPLHQNEGVFRMVPCPFYGMKQIFAVRALTEFDGQLATATSKKDIKLLTFLDGCQRAFGTGLLRLLRSSDPINRVNDAISGCSSAIGPMPQCLFIGSTCLI